TIKQQLATEISRFFRGGVPTTSDIHEWEHNLNAANSKAQLMQVIQKDIPELMAGGLGALEDQYTRVMDKPPTPGFTTARSLEQLKRIGAPVDQFTNTPDQLPESPSAQETPTLQRPIKEMSQEEHVAKAQQAKD